MDNEYIASEQFIHDRLLLVCASIVGNVRAAWSETLDVPPMAVAWPGRTIFDDEGNTISKKVLLELTRDKNRKEVLTKFVERTSAYGLLVVESSKEGLHALFETKKGSVSWHFRRERHGDISVLSEPEVLTDKKTFGIEQLRG